MRVIDVEQGSQEWRKERLAKVTGTRMDSVMGSQLDQLMLACELIAEEATEQGAEFKATKPMVRGIEEEPFARKAFQEATGKKVEELGFCISDEYDYLGVSGDGWIKHKGKYTEALENKSPDSKIAVFYTVCTEMPPEELGLGSYSTVTKTNPEPVFKPSAKAAYYGIPAQYKWQVITYFVVNTDLQKLYFTVFDSRFIDDRAKLKIVEITREQVQNEIDEAVKELVKFREFWLKLRGIIIKDDF